MDTPVRPQRIRAYSNGGLVVTRRSERLFSAWYKDFLTLEHAGHLPPEGMRYMDQLSLGATIARRWDRTQILDWRYNYPLPHRAALAEPARSAALDDLIHVHYHQWLARPGYLDTLVPPLADPSPIRSFLEPHLPLQPVLPRRQRAPRIRPVRTAKRSGIRTRVRRLLGRGCP